MFYVFCVQPRSGIIATHGPRYVVTLQCGSAAARTLKFIVMNREQLVNLSETEKTLLFRAPVIITLLAAGRDGKISELQRSEAIKRADIKAFAAPEMLRNYYAEAAKNFERDLDAVVGEYAPLNDNSLKRLEREVDDINHIISKLEPALADALRKSLAAYARHIHNADADFVANYLLPFMN